MSDALTIAGLLNLGHVDHLAIADYRGEGLTYRRVRLLIEDTHEFLANLGLTGQDTVAVSLRNGPETAALFLALCSYCRVAPLNPSYTAPEIAFALDDLQARAIVTTVDNDTAVAAARLSGVRLILLETSTQPGAFHLHADPIGERSVRRVPGCDDIALLLHTSGTTARPKLVPLTQRNLYLSAINVAAVLELRAVDRCLSIMPLFHIHGLVAGLLASIAAGATVCCAPGFQATSVFSWLEASQATWYTAVPTMHQAILLRARHNSRMLANHTLRLIRSSSSPLYPAVWKQLESTFGVPVINAYGMTEAAHQISSVRLSDGKNESLQGTVGWPSGPEVAILDCEGLLLPAGQIGEVALRGPQIMSAYLQPAGINEAAFVNGWFRTGDEGFLNALGVLTLCGRIKEMINSGGEKISPYEVEEALLNHDAVSQAVAFAAPHALLGEEVVAAVVSREGCQLDTRHLLLALRSSLARCKTPRRIVIVDEIPRGATGKVQRIGLAARLGMAKKDFHG